MKNKQNKSILKKVSEGFKNLKPVQKTLCIFVLASVSISMISGVVSLVNYINRKNDANGPFVEEPREDTENIIEPKRSPIEIYMEDPDKKNECCVVDVELDF